MRAVRLPGPGRHLSPVSARVSVSQVATQHSLVVSSMVLASELPVLSSQLLSCSDSPLVSHNPLVTSPILDTLQDAIYCS